MKYVILQSFQKNYHIKLAETELNTDSPYKNTHQKQKREYGKKKGRRTIKHL